MRRRRTAEEVVRSMREADRDLAKGLTIADICRKQGIAEATYYRWRQQHDPGQVDTDRRCRELEREVDRLKRLVAELLLDKQMLQEIAKKKVVTPNQQRAAADFLGERYRVSQRRVCRVMGRARSTLRYRRRRQADEPALSREVKRLARRHPRYGYRRVHALLAWIPIEDIAANFSAVKALILAVDLRISWDCSCYTSARMVRASPSI